MTKGELILAIRGKRSIIKEIENKILNATGAAVWRNRLSKEQNYRRCANCNSKMYFKQIIEYGPKIWIDWKSCPRCKSKDLLLTTNEWGEKRYYCQTCADHPEAEYAEKNVQYGYINKTHRQKRIGKTRNEKWAEYGPGNCGGKMCSKNCALQWSESLMNMQITKNEIMAELHILLAQLDTLNNNGE